MSTLLDVYGIRDSLGTYWRVGEAWEANELLRRHHYLGPLQSGAALTIVGDRDGQTVAAMMWKHPTSRRIPPDGTWLELSRWCLTPAAGEHAGSRMHRWAQKLIAEHIPAATTLLSYSDPTHGHTGTLYRACNWRWAPTWLRLRPPPSGQGDWGGRRQAVKDRWVFPMRTDTRTADVLRIGDPAAIRYWRARATPVELKWAALSPCAAELLVEDAA